MFNQLKVQKTDKSIELSISYFTAILNNLKINVECNAGCLDYSILALWMIKKQ